MLDLMDRADSTTCVDGCAATHRSGEAEEQTGDDEPIGAACAATQRGRHFSGHWHACRAWRREECPLRLICLRSFTAGSISAAQIGFTSRSHLTTKSLPPFILVLTTKSACYDSETCQHYGFYHTGMNDAQHGSRQHQVQNKMQSIS